MNQDMIARVERLAERRSLECSGMHHGIGSPECPSRLHHHHDEKCWEGLSDYLALQSLLKEVRATPVMRKCHNFLLQLEVSDLIANELLKKKLRDSIEEQLAAEQSWRKEKYRKERELMEAYGGTWHV